MIAQQQHWWQETQHPSAPVHMDRCVMQHMHTNTHTQTHTHTSMHTCASFFPRPISTSTLPPCAASGAMRTMAVSVARLTVAAATSGCSSSRPLTRLTHPPHFMPDNNDKHRTGGCSTKVRMRTRHVKEQHLLAQLTGNCMALCVCVAIWLATAAAVATVAGDTAAAPAPNSSAYH